MRARDLGAARADEAGEADDLAAAQLERDVGEEPAAREALGPEDDVADLRLLLREELVERAPDHEPDDLGLRELAPPAASRCDGRRGCTVTTSASSPTSSSRWLM